MRLIAKRHHSTRKFKEYFASIEFATNTFATGNAAWCPLGVFDKSVYVDFKTEQKKNWIRVDILQAQFDCAKYTSVYTLIAYTRIFDIKSETLISQNNLHLVWQKKNKISLIHVYI